MQNGKERKWEWLTKERIKKRKWDWIVIEIIKRGINKRQIKIK